MAYEPIRLVPQSSRFRKPSTIPVQRKGHFCRDDLAVSIGLIALGHILKQHAFADRPMRVGASSPATPGTTPTFYAERRLKFGDGMFWVAEDGDVLPGVFRADGIPGRSIYWERRLDASNEGLPLANYCAPGPAYVELRPGEFFRSVNSGGWTRVADSSPEIGAVNAAPSGVD